MATRNEPEIHPMLRRFFIASRLRTAEIGRKLDAIEGKAQENEFEEKIDTAVTALQGAAKAVVEAASEARQKMPSASEINVTVAMPPQSSKRSDAPGSATMDVHFPIIGGHIRARGMRTVLVVAGVALLLALAWMAGSRRDATLPEAPHAPAEAHS